MTSPPSSETVSRDLQVEMADTLAKAAEILEDFSRFEASSAAILQEVGSAMSEHCNELASVRAGFVGVTSHLQSEVGGDHKAAAAGDAKGEQNEDAGEGGGDVKNNQ